MGGLSPACTTLLGGTLCPLRTGISHNLVGKLRHRKCQEALSHKGTPTSVTFSPRAPGSACKGQIWGRELSWLCPWQDRFEGGGIDTGIIPIESIWGQIWGQESCHSG